MSALKNNMLKSIHKRKARYHPYQTQTLNDYAKNFKRQLWKKWLMMNGESHEIKQIFNASKRGAPFNRNSFEEMKEDQKNSAVCNTDNHQAKENTSVNHWTLTVPMKGFNREDIKTLVFRDRVYVVAKWLNADGNGQLGVTKRLIIPNYVDSKKLKVKLHETGLLILNAPLKSKKHEETKDSCARKHDVIDTLDQRNRILKDKNELINGGNDSSNRNKSPARSGDTKFLQAFKVPPLLTPIDDRKIEDIVKQNATVAATEKKEDDFFHGKGAKMDTREDNSPQSHSVDNKTDDYLNTSINTDADLTKTDQANIDKECSYGVNTKDKNVITSANSKHLIFQMKFEVDKFPCDKLEVFVKENCLLIFGTNVYSDGDVTLKQSATSYFNVPDNVDTSKIMCYRNGNGPLVIFAPFKEDGTVTVEGSRMRIKSEHYEM